MDRSIVIDALLFHEAELRGSEEFTYEYKKSLCFERDGKRVLTSTSQDAASLYFYDLFPNIRGEDFWENTTEYGQLKKYYKLNSNSKNSRDKFTPSPGSEVYVEKNALGIDHNIVRLVFGNTDELSRFLLEYFSTPHPSPLQSKHTVLEKWKSCASPREKLKLLGTFDLATTGTRRLEQDILRKSLLNEQNFANCAICGSEFPEDLLVAAHIKKRKECSHEERGDIDNVAALMCKLGCDELYEKGYIYVEKSVVTINNKPIVTSALKKALKRIEGKAVPNWDSSQKYYNWHQCWNTQSH